MRFILFLFQITFVKCVSNSIYTPCQTNFTNSPKTDRITRCSDFNKILNYYSTMWFGNEPNVVENKVHNGSVCSASENHFVSKDGIIVNDSVLDIHWYEFKSIHNKIYETIDHEMAALSKWRNNLRRVAQHNRDFLNGKQSYSLHLNLFGDLDVKDYFTKFLKLFQTVPLYDPAEDHQRTAYKRSLRHAVPKKVDWRSKGFRPLREDQHDCGACYAFAVTHALQAQLYKKHKKWGELSPQQIVDCSYVDGNKGCGGGSLRAALRYAARDGLVAEAKYPYIGKEGNCKHHALKPRIRVRRWATLPAGDEKAIERALATVGPLAVALNAAPWTFQLYRSGVYDDIFCTSWQLNHAMLLVGYTPEYWILLNWWGKNWGEDGYIRIRRGFNRCGVTNMATYVEL